MSSTLTWKQAALTTKTGTANADFINDLVTNVNSMSGDSAYPWVVASSQNTTPFYVVLKPKSGAAGRILVVIWGSAPAGNNSAILGGAPTTSNVYVAWFPSGNVDTPSNLTASSGTILGNDTGAVKVSTGQAISTVYAASVQLFTVACADGVIGVMGQPGSVSTYWWGAGKLVVDSTDTEQDCVWSSGANSFNSASQSSNWTWTTSTVTAGVTSNACVRTNYGGTDKVFFQAYNATSWIAAGTPGAATDIMLDTSLVKAYFVPYPLVGQGKGSVNTLKLRQIAIGPNTVAQFTVYNTTGPVQAAFQPLINTGGNAVGFIWLTNFKV